MNKIVKNEPKKEVILNTLCYICQKITDHVTSKCPNSTCKNCGEKGHTIKHCLDKKPDVKNIKVDENFPKFCPKSEYL